MKLGIQIKLKPEEIKLCETLRVMEFYSRKVKSYWIKIYRRLNHYQVYIGRKGKYVLLGNVKDLSDLKF